MTQKNDSVLTTERWLTYDQISTQEMFRLKEISKKLNIPYSSLEVCYRRQLLIDETDYQNFFHSHLEKYIKDHHVAQDPDILEFKELIEEAIQNNRSILIRCNQTLPSLSAAAILSLSFDQYMDEKYPDYTGEFLVSIVSKESDLHLQTRDLERYERQYSVLIFIDHLWVPEGNSHIVTLSPWNDQNEIRSILKKKRTNEQYKRLEYAGLRGWTEPTLALMLSWPLVETSPRQQIDVATLGIVSSISSFKGVNRFILKDTLENINKNGVIFPGLNALLKDKPRPIDINDLALRTGLLLNMSGGIGEPRLAYQAFTTQDKVEAEHIIKKCNINIKVRQEMTRDYLESIQNKVLPNHQPFFHLVSYPKNLIQLTLNYIANLYRRLVVIGSEDNQVISGYLRSIEGHPLERFLSPNPNFPELRYSHLTGEFRIEYSQWSAFCQWLTQCWQSVQKNVPQYIVDIDATQFSLKDLYQVYDDLMPLEPTGKDVPRPTLLIRGAMLHRQSLMGKFKEHINFKIILPSEETEVTGYYWYGKEYYPLPAVCDLLFYIRKNLQGEINIEVVSFNPVSAPKLENPYFNFLN